METRKITIKSLLLLAVVLTGCGKGGDSTSTWGSPEAILSSAENHRIAIDGDGKVIVVASGSVNGEIQVWANRFDGNSWGADELISATEDYYYAISITHLQLVASRKGTFIAVWTAYAPGRTDLWANFFDGNRWRGAQLIAKRIDAAYGSPRVVMENNGKTIVTWLENDGVQTSARAIHFDGENWGAAVWLETLNWGTTVADVFFIGSDRAKAVWVQSEGDVSYLWENDFSSKGWSGMVKIDLGLGEEQGVGAQSMDTPEFSFKDSGRAAVIWLSAISYRSENRTHYSVWSTIFDGDNWGVAELISEFDHSYYESQPRKKIAINGSGQVIVAWEETGQVWIKRYDGKVWGAARLMGTGNSPQIAIDNNGKAMVSWIDGAGVRAIHFDGEDWGVDQRIDTDAGISENFNIGNFGKDLTIAAWHENGFIYANQFNGNWDMPIIISYGINSSSSNLQLVSKGDGKGVATWKDHNGIVWANHIK